MINWAELNEIDGQRNFEIQEETRRQLREHYRERDRLAPYCERCQFPAELEKRERIECCGGCANEARVYILGALSLAWFRKEVRRG